jgi:hypothetical protein
MVADIGIDEVSRPLALVVHGLGYYGEGPRLVPAAGRVVDK